jgi:hypothetical protein
VLSRFDQLRSARGIRSVDAIGAGVGAVVVIVLDEGVLGVVVLGVVEVLGVVGVGDDVVGALMLPALPGALGDCVLVALPRVPPPPWSLPELDEPVPVVCANDRPMVPATKSAATVDARVLREFILYS